MSVADWLPRSRAAIVQAFGSDADLFSRLLAGTSPISSIEANVLIAVRVYRHLNWFGYVPRNGLLNVHYICVTKLMNDPVAAGRKVWSLWQNLIGNEDVCPIDRWIKKFYGYDPERRLPDKLYTKLENKIKHEAKALGITPAQRQVQIWCASREAGASRGDVSYGDIIIERELNKEGILRRLL